MTKRILIGVAILIFVGVLAFLAYAWQPAIDRAEPPDASSFAADLVEKGSVLAGAGNCASCHTKPGGAEYAGGRAVRTGFGTIYSANITPDPETGIGVWSEAAFVRAMRKGVRRDGGHLFPAFPYTHFAKVSDDDLKALYAYFMTRKPVKAAKPRNSIPFPLNIRLLQAGWKLLFFDGAPFRPDTDKSAAWNRGAYLAEGLGHCSACHSPRNALGAEQGGGKHYAGAVIDGWYAPALTEANGAALPWTEDELFDYLRFGITQLHGAPSGSMSAVVHDGLRRLPDSDIKALAVYFASLAKAPSSIGKDEIAAAMRRQTDHPYTVEDDKGARLYAAACASCHYNRAGAPLAARPDLALNSAVTGPDPTTFIRVVLEGVTKDEGLPVLFMHGYAGALSDADIAAIAGYLHHTYAGAKGTAAADAKGWRHLESRVRKIRKREETEK